MLNRNEPRSEASAKRIIYLARRGERDPVFCANTPSGPSRKFSKVATKD
jgi:hypothetical protein